MLTFPGGKTRALTFSYDDGISQDMRLVQLFNLYGLKGTFNLVDEHHVGIIGPKGRYIA